MEGARACHFPPSDGSLASATAATATATTAAWPAEQELQHERASTRGHKQNTLQRSRGDIERVRPPASKREEELVREKS